ncbi:protein mxiK, partial [Shigella flexneri]|nr:protein mxiK [Shigella sonnei]EFW4609049.1 protein mxiK [Shigella flexneri]EFW6734805.1 protein mxiK [Shigella flexneri]EFW9585024.1 protein mxiK [Shigella sonnei]EFY9171202.1 protein mxiK [Shigella flexneri]
MIRMDGIYKKYLSIIFDPAFYINRNR